MATLDPAIRQAQGQMALDLASKIMLGFVSENGTPIYDPVAAMQLAVFMIGYAFSEGVAEKIEEARQSPQSAYAAVFATMERISQQVDAIRQASMTSHAAILFPTSRT